MGRKLSSLALIGTVLAGLVAYLYNVPNSEGVEQMDRIRLLSAAMKLIGFVVSMIFFIIIRLPSRYSGQSIRNGWFTTCLVYSTK